MNKLKDYIQIGDVWFCLDTTEVFDGLPGKLLGYGEIVHKGKIEGGDKYALNYYPTKEELEKHKA